MSTTEKCACHVTFPDGTKVAIKDTKARQDIKDLKTTLEEEAKNLTKGGKGLAERLEAVESGVYNVTMEVTDDDGVVSKNHKALSEGKMDKITNDSGADKVVVIEKESSTPILKFFKETAGDTYDSIPFRKSINHDKHPGTFEVAHPVMDSTSTKYSDKHPVTVKTLIDYVEDHASGSGTGSGGTGVTYENATTEKAGLMSADDKAKLDGIAYKATRNTTTASQTADGLMSVDDKIKLDSIEAVTTTKAGLMTASDKAKLDGIEAGANNYDLLDTTDPAGRFSDIIGLHEFYMKPYKIFEGGEFKGKYNPGYKASLMTEAERIKLAGIEEGATAGGSGGSYDLDVDGSFEEVISLETEYLSEKGTDYTHRLITKAEADKLAGIEEGATAGGSGGASYDIATSDNPGLMSPADRMKLDSIEEDANLYTLSVDGTFDEVISLEEEYLSELGDNYSRRLITKEEANKLANIPEGSNVTIPNASSTNNGLMSADQFMKLNGYANTPLVHAVREFTFSTYGPTTGSSTYCIVNFSYISTSYFVGCSTSLKTEITRFRNSGNNTFFVPATGYIHDTTDSNFYNITGIRPDSLGNLIIKGYRISDSEVVTKEFTFTGDEQVTMEGYTTLINQGY